MNLWAFLPLWLISCALHEIGHYIIAAYYNANPKFGHHGLDPYVSMSIPKWESPEKTKIINRNVGLAGVSFQGTFLLPMIILFAMDPVNLFLGVAFIFIGSCSDLLQVRKVLMAKRNQNDSFR